MRRITDLASSTSIVENDLIEIVDINDFAMSETGTNKSVTAELLANSLTKMINDDVDIVVSSDGNAVKISQSGDGNALLVYDEDPDTSPFVITHQGNVGIGTLLPSVNTKLDVVGAVKATSFVGPLTGTVTGNVTGNAGTVTDGVYTTGDQSIGGTKTFSSNIVGNVTGNITGNAGTVTDGVYASTNQTITGTKTFSSNIVGNITGNAGTVTNGVYTSGDQNIISNKTFINGSPSSAITTSINSIHGYPISVYSDGGSIAVCGAEAVYRSFTIGGTLSAPTAVGDNAVIGSIRAFAYNGSAFNGYGFGGTSGINFISKGVQSSTNSGGYISLYTTAENTGNTPAERMRIDHNGNVGIGTETATARLTISANQTSNTPSVNGIYCRNYGTNADDNAVINVCSSTATGGDAIISWDIAGVRGWCAGIDNSDNDKFKIADNWSDLTAGTRMVIDPTTGHTSFLITNYTEAQVAKPPTWGGGISTWDVYATGSIGVGSPNTSPRAGMSAINGNVFGSGFTSTSSVRFKKDVEPLKYSLDKIQKLQGVSYKWKETDKQDIGLIAEETHKVLPEIVYNNESGIISGLDYGKLVAVLVEAVKEQQKIINDLSSRLEVLENKLA